MTFNIADLEDKNTTYLIRKINNKTINIQDFNIYINNSKQIINPFLDELIDNNKSLINTPIIEWYNYIQIFENTIYYHKLYKWKVEYRDNFINNYKNNLNNHNREYQKYISIYVNDTSTYNKSKKDYCTIKILCKILDQNYIINKYKNKITLDNISYLKNQYDIYKVPSNTVEHIIYLTHIEHKNDTDCIYCEKIGFKPNYVNNIDWEIIHLN